jgi:hypothetical protein
MDEIEVSYYVEKNKGRGKMLTTEKINEHHSMNTFV